MSVKRIRTILIGCGMVGRMHAEVAAAHDHSELVAVCAPRLGVDRSWHGVLEFPSLTMSAKCWGLLKRIVR